MIGGLPFYLNDTFILCTEFIVQDPSVDFVAAFGKACHDRVVRHDPVFVFSVGEGCVEDCVCFEVICDHDIFISTV